MSDQWKLVPTEPTEEMLAAARPAYSSNIQASNTANRDKYQRMLAAAPMRGTDGESLRPVAIYQMRDHEEHDLWRDVDEVVYGGLIDEMRRIVYAIYDAAPSDAISDVLAERERQDAQWGGQDHDDQHTKADWQNYIYRQHYAASSFCGTPEQYRVRLVKIAALAVAAIESIDRLAASAPREKT